MNLQRVTVEKDGAGYESKDKLARDIMISAAQYPMISENATIREAIADLMSSYDGYISNKRLIYTVHRSMLVVNNIGQIVGIVSVRNMIQALTPDKESGADPEHEFWTRSKDLATRKVKTIMQRTLARVHEDTKLTEIASVMARYNTRRVVVIDGSNEIIGIVREQELFFEMANIIL